MFSINVLQFYKSLSLDASLPRGVEVMNPYRNTYTVELCSAFFEKYFHDNLPRTLLVGINPGRFGSGTTGVSFTDPVKLEKVCGISNTLAKKAELSADFIYQMIDAFGGSEKFYRRHFISAVCPLGFTKNGTNLNYYDDPKLQKAVTPFIVDSFRKTLSFGIQNEKCYCIGEGKNFKCLTELNLEHKWFGEIIPLPHPRFIMQYKRKQIVKYIDRYLKALE